ncbi:hypothetical protein DER44DRAFT_738099 [Fusarium oxysporum]|nr:hypothetical protein DER44DRAFT_738099 [Fusarium oxysporum]
MACHKLHLPNWLGDLDPELGQSSPPENELRPWDLGVPNRKHKDPNIAGAWPVTSSVSKSVGLHVGPCRIVLTPNMFETDLRSVAPKIGDRDACLSPRAGIICKRHVACEADIEAGVRRNKSQKQELFDAGILRATPGDIRYSRNYGQPCRAKKKDAMMQNGSSFQGLVHAQGPPTVPNPPSYNDDHCGGNGSGLARYKC